MKVVAKPIEVISHTNTKGEIHPLRFKLINDNDSSSVVKIDKVITIEVERLAGNYMRVYKCQSLINGIIKIYELKYELSTCIWLLWKI